MTIKTRRICPGAYVTRNTAPVARIEKEEFGWRVSYGDYSSAWPTKAECLSLLESVATYGLDHEYPIVIGDDR